MPKLALDEPESAAEAESVKEQELDTTDGRTSIRRHLISVQNTLTVKLPEP